ncbi:thiolase family protein [Bordetella petrii]|nr:thiolase family protein [Bordetella petrii]
MSRRAPLAAVIAGVGESPLGLVPQFDALGLQRQAALSALADAGLAPQDIDGLLTTPLRVENWAMPCGVVADGLGLQPRYLATLDVAGASGVAMAHHAAMAVATGQCETVLCVAGQNLLSFHSRGAAVQKMADAGWAHPEFEAPYGPMVPTLYALAAQRHMHEYGTTFEQMAEVAVAMRAHAARNPLAHKRDPISLADVMQSRMITSPLRLLDCALVSDGAAAFIVTTPERARDLRQPAVKLLGHGYGHSHTYIGDYRNVTTTGAVQSGRDAYAMAGLAPADIDVAELYDCFTITVIIELEDLGFCAKGEGGRYVEHGAIGPGGRLPVTTHGGLLSAGHPGLAGGMLHLVEGVRQIRGQAGERQVPNAEVALVHGNGGIIGLHATLIIAKA